MPRQAGQTPPTYRKKKINGKFYAYVTLPDVATGKRRDVYLGPYGTPPSHERYLRVLADWRAAGCTVPVLTETKAPQGLTVTQLCEAFWRDQSPLMAEKTRVDYRCPIRMLREYYGTSLAAAFGPKALKRLRAEMVAGNPQVTDNNGKPKTKLLANGKRVPVGADGNQARKPWSRNVANKRARLVIAVWKWGAAEELLPPSAHAALRTLKSLSMRQGVTYAEVPPAPMESIEAMRPHMSRHIRAMVDLQLVTGMRPGELVRLRPCDMDRSSDVWTYRPAADSGAEQAHKNAWRGKNYQRVVYLGPTAQGILEPFLAGRPLSAPVFSPAEAEAERLAKRHAARKTPLNCGNRPGTRKKAAPKRTPADVYTSDSYRRAIDYVWAKANREAIKTARAAGMAIEDGTVLVERWRPHQLRHNAATAINREQDAEAARVLLGHRSINTTQIYIEADHRKAAEVARKIG